MVSCDHTHKNKTSVYNVIGYIESSSNLKCLGTYRQTDLKNSTNCKFISNSKDARWKLTTCFFKLKTCIIIHYIITILTHYNRNDGIREKCVKFGKGYLEVLKLVPNMLIFLWYKLKWQINQKFQKHDKNGIQMS